MSGLSLACGYVGLPGPVERFQHRLSLPAYDPLVGLVSIDRALVPEAELDARCLFPGRLEALHLGYQVCSVTGEQPERAAGSYGR